MGRRPQPEIRDRLLERCVDHVLDHGLPDRLGPFVEATGTSSRMLVYHFGSRDGLLREVLLGARRRQLDAFGRLLAPRPDEAYPVTLERAWAAMSGAEGAGFLRIFRSLHDTGGAPLWPGFRRAATTDWLGPLEDGLATIGRPELATLTLAVVRGLLQDRQATGDVERTDRAFAAFVATLTPPGHVPDAAMG